LKSLRSPLHLRLTTALVAAREKAGVTQQQLADRLGKPQSYVAKYEGGERRLDVVEYIEIAEALGFDAGRVVRELVTHLRSQR
jgi:transcriptional regulator with XRE-family HTH domain